MNKESGLGSLIAKIAVTDEQTGVYTFSHFQNMLEAETERGQRYKRSLTIAVVHIDVPMEYDTPEQIQDGAELIREFAMKLTHTVRRVDIVARRGVKDFVVALPETDATKAEFFVSRFRKVLAEASIADRPEGVVTASIGAATFPDHADDPLDLLAAAEAAMQKAAAAGGDLFVKADAEIAPETSPAVH